MGALRPERRPVERARAGGWPLLRVCVVGLAAMGTASAQPAAPPPGADRPLEAPAPAAPAPVAPAEPATNAQRLTATTVRLVLKVIRPDAARRSVIADAEALGGFPVLVTERAVSLKLPHDRLDAATRDVARHGTVLDKALSREDLTLRVAQAQAQVRSKQEILAHLRRLFADSGADATLQIEQRMAALVGELESLKGRLRVDEDRTRWAVLEVAFDFRERERLVYVQSPFQWLNSVDVGRFNADFFAR